MESLLKTKKYAIPIVVIEPYVLAGIAVTYFTSGRFRLNNHAPAISTVADQEQALAGGKINFPVSLVGGGPAADTGGREDQLPCRHI